MMKIRRHTKHTKREEVVGTPTYDSTGQAINTEASRIHDSAKATVAQNTGVSPSSIGLSVALALVLLALIGGCVWYKLRRRRQQRDGTYHKETRHSTLFGLESRAESESSSIVGVDASIEKPSKAFTVDAFRNEQAGWTPQIKSYHGVPVINGKLPAHLQAAREGRSVLDEKSSPPPAYSTPTVVVHGPPGIPLPPTPESKVTVTPPSPPASLGEKPKLSLLSTTEQPQVPSSRFSLSPNTAGLIPEALPSPLRTSSFSPVEQSPISPLQSIATHISSVFKSGTGNDGLPLPRMMSVINTFTPSLEDEMLIHIGDTVRMLEEYTDGWCLVQRVGKPDAPKGVAPRFCLGERQSVVPVSSTKQNLLKSIHTGSKRF